VGRQISLRRALIASGRMSERHRLSRETGVRGTPLLCFGLACHGTLVDGSRADREPGDERHHPAWGALSESSNCSNVPLTRSNRLPAQGHSSGGLRRPRTPGGVGHVAASSRRREILTVWLANRLLEHHVTESAMIRMWGPFPYSWYSSCSLQRLVQPGLPVFNLRSPQTRLTHGWE
jgi:hypothetical protein